MASSIQDALEYMLNPKKDWRYYLNWVLFWCFWLVVAACFIGLGALAAIVFKI